MALARAVTRSSSRPNLAAASTTSTPAAADPEYVHAALEDSLRRLGTDRVDLLILHRPDPTTPIADTLGALDELVRAGKVREIGCSNFSLDQLEEAERATAPGAARFVNLQNRFSLLQRDPERGLLARCAEDGIGFVPHTPLAGGLLTGKYRRDAPPPDGSRIAGMPAERREQTLSEDNFAAVEALTKFCEARGHTLLELAFSWLLTRPGVASVIAGATSPEQVAANVAAAGWSLDSEDLAAVDGLAPVA